MLQSVGCTSNTREIERIDNLERKEKEKHYFFHTLPYVISPEFKQNRSIRPLNIPFHHASSGCVQPPWTSSAWSLVAWISDTFYQFLQLRSRPQLPTPLPPSCMHSWCLIVSVVVAKSFEELAERSIACTIITIRHLSKLHQANERTNERMKRTIPISVCGTKSRNNAILVKSSESQNYCMHNHHDSSSK